MRPETWSAIAGGASAITAALSLIVTFVGLRYQRKNLLEAMRKNVIDALTYQAERANASCSGKSDSEWSFSEFANIMFATRYRIVIDKPTLVGSVVRFYPC